MDDASKSVERRGGVVDEKIKKLDDELLKYKQQMAKMKPGPARKQIEARALRTLKQKKLYEKQRDSLYNQQFNIDQTKFATENARETVTMVDAMKSAQTELKSAFKEIDIDNIEDLHDDMSELMEQSEEVQDVLGRSYGLPEEVSEADLLEELNGLEDEIESEAVSDEVPSYLVNAASASKVDERKAPSVEVDAGGMPRVPVRELGV